MHNCVENPPDPNYQNYKKAFGTLEKKLGTKTEFPR